MKNRKRQLALPLLLTSSKRSDFAVFFLRRAISFCYFLSRVRCVSRVFSRRSGLSCAYLRKFVSQTSGQNTLILRVFVTLLETVHRLRKRELNRDRTCLNTKIVTHYIPHKFLRLDDSSLRLHFHEDKYPFSAFVKHAVSCRYSAAMKSFWNKLPQPFLHWRR